MFNLNIKKESTKLCKVTSFENKLLNKPKPTHLQETTSKVRSRHQDHNMAMSSPCSSCLIRQEVDVQQAGQFSFTFWPGGFCSWRLLLSAGISHSGQVPLHNTSPTWAPPPQLTLNKHPLHYPSLHKTKKVRYIQASLGMTRPSPPRLGLQGTNFHSRSGSG